MREDYPVSEWIARAQPAIEQHFGPMPEFEVRRGRAHPIHEASGTSMGMYADYRTKTWFLKWYPKQMTIDLSTPFGAATLLFDVVHEISHSYQNELFELPCEVPWSQWHWLEGCADLAAMHVWIDGLRRDENPLQPLLDTLNPLYVDDPQANPATQVPIRLGWILAILTRSRTIERAHLSELTLPFKIGKPVQEEAEDFARRYLRRTLRNYNYMLPYALGFMRCAQIVAEGEISLPDLLRTPLTSRKLRTLTRK